MWGGFYIIIEKIECVVSWVMDMHQYSNAVHNS
jgi:hypothetical protein